MSMWNRMACDSVPVLAWHVSCFEFIEHIFTSNNYRDAVDHCIRQTVEKLADSLNAFSRQFRVTEQPV
jgi:hypothetical protein